MLHPWKTLSRHVILDHSDFLKVEDHTIELPDGRVIEDWPWIVIPDFTIVIVETTENRYLFFRQRKYAVDGITLAPVGGHIEKDEDPIDGAKRELMEETGYEASEWIHLGSFRMGANRGICTGHLYLARAACPKTSPKNDDLEEQELLFLTRQEMKSAYRKGEFKAMPWMTAVGLALEYLKNES